MRQEIANRWADLLESGNYPQAKGYLHVPDRGYCCLGVLCEVAVEDEVVEKRITVFRRGDGAPYAVAGQYVHVGDDEENGYELELPPVVSEWAGLATLNPWFDVRHDKGHEFCNGYAQASELNDSYGYSFADIAKLIRDGKLIDTEPEVYDEA